MASKRKILKKVRLGLLAVPAKWRSVVESPEVAEINVVAEASPAVVEAPVVKKAPLRRSLRKAPVEENTPDAVAPPKPRRRQRRTSLKTEE